jgi:hypothetical protein
MIVLLSQLARQAKGLNHSSRGHRPRYAMAFILLRPVRALQLRIERVFFAPLRLCVRPLPLSSVPSLSQPIPSYPNLSQQFLEKNGLFNFGLRLCTRCVPPSREGIFGSLLKAIEAYSNPLKGIFEKNLFFRPVTAAYESTHPFLPKWPLRFCKLMQAYTKLRKPMQATPPLGGVLLPKRFHVEF